LHGAQVSRSSGCLLSGLRKEGAKVEKILRKAGFEVSLLRVRPAADRRNSWVSRENEKVHPGQSSDVQPIVQAKLLNKARTDFNILMDVRGA